MNIDARGPTIDADAEQATVGPRAALTAEDRAELFGLLSEHFEGVTAAQFAADLDRKDWAIRIRRGGRLVGFSTIQVFDAMHQGQRVRVVYSGDTIVAPEAWGSPVLARAWIAHVRRLQTAHPGDPWYWLLLSSGFRTYRFLPVFWRNFWPRCDVPTPPDAARLLDALARARFGDEFDATAGIVRFPRPQRLRPRLAAVPRGRVDDDHVRFFLTRNPGHAAGDELVCLTALSDDNLTAAGRRMIRGHEASPGRAGA